VTTVPRLKEKLSYLTNLHVMEKETITLGDATFVCGTLWTDMNREDPITLSNIAGVMNDFRIIRYGNRRFHPQDTVDDHTAMLAVIRAAVAANPTGRFVVVGHHSPSKLSTHPRYQDEVIVNGAYSSDLSELMLDHPQIQLWTHGHTHHEFDYMIGTCRVVCNPRGYIGHEDQASTWQLKTVQV